MFQSGRQTSCFPDRTFLNCTTSSRASLRNIHDARLQTNYTHSKNNSSQVEYMYLNSYEMSVRFLSNHL